MKITSILKLVSTGLMSLALPSMGQDYEYQFSAPINGWFQQGAADPGLDYQGIGQIFNFGTLSETVYYNPTANTIQQVGSFSISPTDFSGSFQDNKSVGGNLIPATVAVNYVLNNGNSIVSFNSGVQPVGVNPAMNWSIPFSESITVTTGGQTYQSLMSGYIPEANTITSVSQFSPSSIVISQGYQNSSEEIGSQYDCDISASDGWSAEIVDGIGDGSLSEYYYVSPVTATAVPEPGVDWLAGFASVLTILRCQRRVCLRQSLKSRQV